MRIIRYISAALAGASFVAWVQSADAANPRIALVIGESAYTDGALPTAANDAGLVAQVLQAAGFDVVGARDLDQKSVRESLRDFLDKANSAGPDMQAFVYFSGRAFQYAGDNYLAPIDAHIARASDAPIEAVKLSDFTHALAAAPGLARVVVIDGARPNPYAQQGEPLAGGLALVDPEPNSVIAFNAAPGAIGVEDSGDYGVYAKSLAGLMRQGGVDINDVLAQVRIDVNQKTQGAQIPWSAGKLTAPYFLFERAADAPPVVVKRAPAKKPLKQLSAEDAYVAVVERDRLEDYEEFLRAHERSKQAKRIEAIVAARREALFWRRAVEQNSSRAYWTYLRRYPKGPHAYDADRRLDALSARRQPPQDFEVIEYEDLPPPPPREIFYADRPVYYFGGDDFGPPPPPPPRDYFVEDDGDDWRELPPPRRPTVAGLLPTLAIAIPLMIAARAYQDRPRPDGRALVNAPQPSRQPLAPPPLPRGVKVVATPTPAATVNPAPNKAPGQVKFTAPNTTKSPTPTASTTPGAQATPTSPATTTTPKGKTPLPTPSATTTTPTGKTPSPTPSATTTTPTGKTPSPTPSATTATPKGKTPSPTPSATTATPKGKTPLPTPSATTTTPTGKAPLPTPSATTTTPTGKTPLPTPSATTTTPKLKTPLPTPSATTTTPKLKTPLPTPSATNPPLKGKTSLPTPSATTTPLTDKTPQPTPSPTGQVKGRTPIATPTAAKTKSNLPDPNDVKTPANKAVAPKPSPTSSKTPAVDVKPKTELLKKNPRKDAANGGGNSVSDPGPVTKSVDPKPRVDPTRTIVAKPTDLPKHSPQPAKLNPVDPPRNLPPKVVVVPKTEPPHPTPIVHANEPPKHVGGGAAAEAKGAKANCGHPGQPHC